VNLPSPADVPCSNQRCVKIRTLAQSQYLH
jgi:hypothetical protein